MTRLTALTVCWLMLAGVALADDETYDLGPRWVEGQAATYSATTTRMTTRTLKAPNLSPPPSSSVTRYTSELTWEVTKVNDDGSARAKMTVTDMSIAIETPAGKKLTVDRRSADEGLEPLQKLVKALIGKPIEVDIDATGHVTKVKGWKAVQSGAGKAGESLTERDFRETASDLAVLMGGPAKAKPGDSWKEKPTWDHELGSVEYDSHYTFDGVEPIADVPVAIVSESAKLKVIPDKDKMKGPGGSELKLKVKQGTRSTQVMFDLSRHEVVGSHAEQVLKLEMSFTLQGKTLTTTIEQESNSQLIRLSEE